VRGLIARETPTTLQYSPILHHQNTYEDSIFAFLDVWEPSACAGAPSFVR
jgi:hypothetical protein